MEYVFRFEFNYKSIRCYEDFNKLFITLLISYFVGVYFSYLNGTKVNLRRKEIVSKRTDKILRNFQNIF